MLLDPHIRYPGWLAFDTALNGDHIVYTASDHVFALVSSPKDGSLMSIGSPSQKVNGSDPAGDGPVALARAVSKSGEHYLFSANYGSGSVGVFALAPDGTIAPTSNDAPAVVASFQFSRPKSDPVGPVTSRQDHSYIHHVAPSPDGRFVYAVDLGTDEIHQLALGSDCKSTSLVSSTRVARGSGPRHITFWPAAGSFLSGTPTFAYVVSELACTLTAFFVDPASGALRMIGEPIVSVPPGTSLGGNATTGAERNVAEVAVSPDGNYVYVSNRGDPVEDHISVFRRDPKTGAVSWKNWFGTNGLHPRHFSLSNDEDATYLVAANMNSNNVVILARDLVTGALKPTGAEIQNFTSPNFAGFSPWSLR